MDSLRKEIKENKETIEKTMKDNVIESLKPKIQDMQSFVSSHIRWIVKDKISLVKFAKRKDAKNFEKLYKENPRKNSTDLKDTEVETTGDDKEMEGPKK